jgi:hypothetical protein
MQIHAACKDHSDCLQCVEMVHRPRVVMKHVSSGQLSAQVSIQGQLDHGSHQYEVV